MYKNKQTQLRIIGGKWRGRKIKVCRTPDVRPTMNMVRETLFNWLSPFIDGAICLDLFSGSGALGFEAYSQGADRVMMMDKSKQVIDTLKENLVKLDAPNIEIVHFEYKPSILQREKNLKLWHTSIKNTKFTIVFLDPPFHKNLIKPCLELLKASNCLAENALIYVEAEKDLDILFPMMDWEVYKQKVNGQVMYFLLR